MAALPFPSPLFHVTDPDTGMPLVAGKVYTYVAGTVSTPKMTWADKDQGAANLNPVILDANGDAPIFGVGAYKIVVKDSAGNLVYELDGVAAVSVAGPTTSTDEAVARFNGTDGATLQNSLVLIDDAGNITGVVSIQVGNTGFGVLDTNGTHPLRFVPGSDLTAARNLVFVTGDASRQIDVSAGNVTFSAYALTLLDDANAAAARVTLGAEIGVNVQAYDADLTTIAGLARVAGDLLYADGTPQWARLAKGVDGEVLTMVAGVPDWTLPAAGTTTILKSADQAKTNDTSLAADSELAFQMAANTTYHIRIAISFQQANANSDLQFSLTGPASPTLVRVLQNLFVPADGVLTGTAGYSLGAAYPGATSVPSANAGVGVGTLELIVQNGATAGTFAFNWAQTVSNANAITVRKGSLLEYMSV